MASWAAAATPSTRASSVSTSPARIRIPTSSPSTARVVTDRGASRSGKAMLWPASSTYVPASPVAYPIMSDRSPRASAMRLRRVVGSSRSPSSMITRATVSRAQPPHRRSAARAMPVAPSTSAYAHRPASGSRAADRGADRQQDRDRRDRHGCNGRGGASSRLGTRGARGRSRRQDCHDRQEQGCRRSNAWELTEEPAQICRDHDGSLKPPTDTAGRVCNEEVHQRSAVDVEQGRHERTKQPAEADHFEQQRHAARACPAQVDQAARAERPPGRDIRHENRGRVLWADRPFQHPERERRRH